MMRVDHFSLLIGLLYLTMPPALAELRLGSPFTDHMVLQCDTPIPVWGKSLPDQQISVAFAGQKHTTRANPQGKWKLTLAPVSGTAIGTDLAVTAGLSQLTLSNVVVGEVWICSGQSNMQFTRRQVPELKGLGAKGIRTFEVPRIVAFEEQDELEGEWKIAAPDSAVAFGFAHHLTKQIENDLPVGIILSAWGSTSIEAWMPRSMTEQFPYFATIMGEWDADQKAQQQIREALGKDKWSTAEDILMRRQSSIIYNAMMKPLIPFACRGLVWYQGERNARYMRGMPAEPWFHRVASIEDYDDVLKTWIRHYREQWQRDDMHFLMVMLPGYGEVLKTSPEASHLHPAAHTWAWMRESQMAALDLPHTAVANTIDLGHIKNIHPKDKAPIGQRLALLAAQETLGKDIASRGPLFKKLEIDGPKALVHFSHAKGLTTTDGKPPTGFWLSDKQGKWVPGTAKINNGQLVEITSSECPHPTEVRYAFAGKPDVNLVNGAGLPAYPFRTDTFSAF